ncbi:WAT1-related protein-like [Iris pallida]|uniref:WAT1-related protein n=1 Tax=Iris pallida TaxID=29817 RepID=A0AAX6HYL4_IRIPA|nr:WAT1-related protein-like [Iris pallida]
MPTSQRIDVRRPLREVQALHRNGLPPVRLCRHERNHQGLPQPRDEPLRARHVPARLCRPLHRPFRSYHGEENATKDHILPFIQIFVLGLLGPVVDQNFYYAGLKFTSPTFSCAMSNILPAMTFVMAVLFRMEKVNLRKVMYQAKVVGTLVTVAGAMLMTLYKGPIVEMVWTRRVHPHQANVPVSMESDDKDWFKGSIFLIIATLAWASLFILQTYTLRSFSSAPLSLTSLICFMGTMQALVVTLVMEHRTNVWSIGFDMNLLAAAYAGIVTSSIAYYVQGQVIQKRGPVFASAFSPLMMIIVAIMGSFILAEKIYLGGVLGAILIVAGLYSVLWGKYKENKEKKEMEAMALPVKSVEASNGKFIDMIEVVGEIEMEKAMNKAVVKVSAPAPGEEAKA